MQRHSLAFTAFVAIMTLHGCASHDVASALRRDLRQSKLVGVGRSNDIVTTPPGSAPTPAETASNDPAALPATLSAAPSDPKIDSTVINKTIANSGATLQVKDLSLLRSSVEACMGKGLLNVSNDMLMPTDLNAPPTPPAADGRLLFLLATQYKAGDDIIDKEAPNMVDLSAGARTNITGDSLTDTYLRSLETIGNVIAHNCSTTNPNCQCGTKVEALAMMSRCFPGLDPRTPDMADSAALLGAICGSGIDGMRKAVSSMISSYAFAVAR